MSNTENNPIVSASTTVTFDAYYERLKQIENIAFQNTTESSNSMQAVSISFLNEPMIDIGLSDRKAYLKPELKDSNADIINYIQIEMEATTLILEEIKKCEKYLSYLYSYRGLSRCLPQVSQSITNNGQLSSNESDSLVNSLYEKTYTVLRPEILKMKEFMNFIEDLSANSMSALAKVSRNMRALEPGAVTFSKIFLCALCKLLDCFIVLDSLKNMKTSLNNDFSMYKRTLTNLQKSGLHTAISSLEQNSDETADNQRLYTFLANHDYISKKLKEDLTAKVLGFEEIFTEMINYALRTLDDIDSIILLPKEKQTLLKAIAYGYTLAASSSAGGIESTLSDAESKKKKPIILKFDRISKVFKMTPIVPLFGDMSINLNSIARKVLPSDLQKVDTEAVKSNYLLIFKIDQKRTEYSDFVAKFPSYLRLMKDVHNLKNAQKTKQIYQFLQSSLKSLTEMTSAVVEQAAWKYSNPAAPNTDLKIPEDATSYELVVRYNYSEAEIDILIEYISMIKSMTQILYSCRIEAKPFIRQHTQNFTLNFVTEFMIHDILPYSLKKKRSTSALIHHLADIIFDSYSLSNLVYEHSTKKQSPGTSNINSLSTHESTITFTQRYFAHGIIEAIFNEKAKGMKGGLMKEKDYKDTHVNEIYEFSKQLITFETMYQFEDTLLKGSDLSELWFKEFYLELSKKIQFPIEMSLPWILTSHMLSLATNSYFHAENLLYAFDIYNDAANQSLHTLKCQYLYNEVEAEQSNCVSIFGTVGHIYIYYAPFSSLLNREMRLRMAISSYGAESSRLIGSDKFQHLFHMKDFKLLGRNIDMNKLLSQRASHFIRKTLELAISRFECNDMTSIIELEHYIETAKIMHETLQKEASLKLDAWNILLKEANEETEKDPISSGGRILNHIIYEILHDIVPAFNFDYWKQVFVLGEADLSLAQRPNFPRCPFGYLFGNKTLTLGMHEYFSPYREFIGLPHFESVIRLAGHSGLTAIINEVSKNMEILIKEHLTEYLIELSKGLPPSQKLPLYEYGTKGTFEYFQAILKPILTYQALKSDVLQIMKEIGNSIALIKSLESAHNARNVFNTLHQASFNQYSEFHQNQEIDGIAFLNFLGGRESLNSEFSSKLNLQSNLLSRIYGNPLKHQFLKKELQKLQKVISEVKGKWEQINEGNCTSEGATTAKFQMEKSREFYRIWSAIFFYVATPQLGEDDSSWDFRFEFGDSVILCGTIFIILMNQKAKYEAFDYSKHLLTVSLVDKLIEDANVSTKETKDSSNNNSIGDANNSTLSAFFSNLKYNSQAEQCIFSCFEHLLEK